MTAFQAKIRNQAGEESTFKLDINELKQIGTMLWPLAGSDLIKISKSANRELHAWLKLGSFNVKCGISTDGSAGAFMLIVTTAGKAHYFSLSATDQEKFHHFVDALNVPEVSDLCEDVLSDAELGSTHISIYAATRPGTDPDFQLSNIIVNGFSYPAESHTIPDQGIYIPIGLFQTEAKITIVWELTVGIVWDGSQVVIGVFRGYNLQNRTVIDKITVESLQTYKGTGTIMV
jgi:hypothetical protein